MSELGFEASEEGFDQMKKASLSYLGCVRGGKTPDESSKRAYDLYRRIIKFEADNNFLEKRYVEY